jgi:hypothetical protein
MSSPGISLPPSPSPSLPSLHTCGHPNGTRLGDHYLIVITDDPLVVGDTIIAIVVVILCRAARTLVHSAIRSRGEPQWSRGDIRGQHTRRISSMPKTRGLGISLSLVRACRRATDRPRARRIALTYTGGKLIDILQLLSLHPPARIVALDRE